MERPLTLKPLSIQDENSAIHCKKSAVDGKSKTSKPVAEKGGVANRSRKALNDITNKSSIHVEASSQKKSSQNKKSNIVEDRYSRCHGFEAEALPKKKISTNEKLNIAEEGFLHDHRKCIEAQKTAHDLNFWDIVFPGHDSSDLIMDQEKSARDADSIHRHPELKESFISESSDWFKSCWKSPPSSPIRLDSPPPYTFSWELEPFQLIFKEHDC
ncbi:hypothetical protein OROGR_019646 [Orobanche gracilis]